MTDTKSPIYVNDKGQELVFFVTEDGKTAAGGMCLCCGRTITVVQEIAGGKTRLHPARHECGVV